MKPYPLLGVLGGLGPMATFCFCEMLTAHTAAATDNDHIDMIVSSRATTPDRTAFILGKSREDPFPVMKEERDRLIRAGADLLVMPCNTAHTFYERLSEGCSVPFLNIIDETVGHLKRRGVRACGLLATEGTVFSGAYGRVCEREGIACLTPPPDEQALISEIIYGAVKQNKPADFAAFLRVSRSLLDRGCEMLVIGCTELSLLRREGLTQPWYLDSLEVLAYRTILACGKTPTGFPASFGGAL